MERFYELVKEAMGAIKPGALPVQKAMSVKNPTVGVRASNLEKRLAPVRAVQANNGRGQNDHSTTAP